MLASPNLAHPNSMQILSNNRPGISGYRRLSKKLLLPMMAIDWSITHSPTPKYLSTQFCTSLDSPIDEDLMLVGLVC
jgi:hypothetical protein